MVTFLLPRAFPDFAMAVKGRALRRALPAALRSAAPA
jgi:hypothetical protein